MLAQYSTFLHPKRLTTNRNKGKCCEKKQPESRKQNQPIPSLIKCVDSRFCGEVLQGGRRNFFLESVCRSCSSLVYFYSSILHWFHRSVALLWPTDRRMEAVLLFLLRLCVQSVFYGPLVHFPPASSPPLLNQIGRISLALRKHAHTATPVHTKRKVIKIQQSRKLRSGRLETEMSNHHTQPHCSQQHKTMIRKYSYNNDINYQLHIT